MATWQPVDSFDIDGGELDGLSPRTCFALGVEWQMVRRQADEQPAAFETLIHAENRDRVAALLGRRGREFRAAFCGDDRSEAWVRLVVGPAPDGQ